MDIYSKEFFKQQGKRGGDATKAKGMDYREVGRLGARKRWGARKTEGAKPQAKLETEGTTGNRDVA